MLKNVFNNNDIFISKWSKKRTHIGLHLVMSILLLTALWIMFCINFSFASNVRQWNIHGSRRQLLNAINIDAELEDRNCTPQAIKQFPTDRFTDYERQHGVVLLHVFVVIYCFLGLAFVCDDYFIPCLELICEALNLSPDVAGATFMAAGSSAPELATSIIGVVIAKDDIGLSSVVGSAVYNVTFVIAVCGFAIPSGVAVIINWYPLARDSFFYAFSICLLTWIISDSYVYWWEAASLVLGYVVYILLMIFNSRLSLWFTNHCSRWLPSHVTETVSKISIFPTNVRDTTEDRNYSYKQLDLNTKLDENCDVLEIDNNTMAHRLEVSTFSIDDENNKDFENDFADDLEITSEWILAFPKGFWKVILHVLLLPLKFFTFITVPDCRRPCCRKFYLITFFTSCAWITVLAYVMIWMITVIGHTLRIPDSIMGLSFVAAGSSVPDAIASVLVMRSGEGDMAVSNAVGSNIFDILICMGCPWLYMTLITGVPVKVFSKGLFYSTITLLTTVLILLVSFHVNKWKLNNRLAILLMIVYCVFVCLAILYELNIFGFVHPPECFTVY